MSSGVPAARLIPCSSPHTVAASSRPMVGWITSPLLRSIMRPLLYSNGRWPLRRQMRWLPSSLFTVALGGCLGGDRSSVHPARGSGPPPYLHCFPRRASVAGAPRRSSVHPARGSGPPPWMRYLRAHALPEGTLDRRHQAIVGQVGPAGVLLDHRDDARGERVG